MELTTVKLRPNFKGFTATPGSYPHDLAVLPHRLEAIKSDNVN